VPVYKSIYWGRTRIESFEGQIGVKRNSGVPAAAGSQNEVNYYNAETVRFNQ